MGRYIIGIILLERRGQGTHRRHRKNIQFMSAKSLSMYIDPKTVLYFSRKRRRPPSAGGWKWTCPAYHIRRKRNGEWERLFGRSKSISRRT